MLTDWLCRCGRVNPADFGFCPVCHTRAGLGRRIADVVVRGVTRDLVACTRRPPDRPHRCPFVSIRGSSGD